MLTVSSDKYTVRGFKDGLVELQSLEKIDYRSTNLVKVIDKRTNQQFFVKGETMEIEPSYSTLRKFNIESINHTMVKLFGHLLSSDLTKLYR